MFDLRPMTVDDLPACLSLWTGMPGITLFPATDSIEGLTRYLNRNPSLSVVAMREGAVVGAALAGHDARRGYLHHVAVAAEHRRKGLGRTMVEWCLTALTRAGIGRCHIFVDAGNDEGKVFWRRVGWEERPGVHVMSVTTDPERA
ncbi:MAG TPA: GNAT family N-acetyltransferase [Gemmataceae bacterium]|nr:GNAT family N-acetyltransferase [Gemmataceae bacterium]